MDFILCYKNGSEKTLKFRTFWDFFDVKDKHIAGVDFIIWMCGKGYEYCFDIKKNNVLIKHITEKKFKKWFEYEAFKKPVELETDEDVLFNL